MKQRRRNRLIRSHRRPKWLKHMSAWKKRTERAVVPWKPLGPPRATRPLTKINPARPRLPPPKASIPIRKEPKGGALIEKPKAKAVKKTAPLGMLKGSIKPTLGRNQMPDIKSSVGYALDLAGQVLSFGIYRPNRTEDDKFFTAAHQDWGSMKDWEKKDWANLVKHWEGLPQKNLGNLLLGNKKLWDRNPLPASTLEAQRKMYEFKYGLRPTPFPVKPSNPGKTEL